MSRSTDAAVLAYAAAHNPCCAGCDHWRYVNSVAGECIRTAPVAGPDRVAMLGMRSSSLPVGAGHIMTTRGHTCGEFADERGENAH
jgi:hypothetical protein